MPRVPTALMVVVALAGASGGVALAQAPLPADFACAAEASKKGLHSAHPGRRPFIAECIATKAAQKPAGTTPALPASPAAKPVAPATPVAPRPRAPLETAEQRRQKIAFSCGAAASKRGLHGGHPGRKTFIDDCIRRAPPVKD